MTNAAPLASSLRRVHGTRRAAWLVAGASLLSGLGIAPEVAAATVVPAGTDFKIWYYKTDEDGDRKNGFSSQDLAGYINRARCECGQEISTKVLLSPAQGGSYNNNTRVQTFIGSRCNEAVGTPQIQIRPCVRAVADFPNAYTKAVNFSFAPIWLAGGINPVAGDQDIGGAVPSGTCSTGQGDAGIWICIEDGMFTDCQANEFQVTGSQNENSTGSSAGQMPAGIHYDFEPPQALPDPTTFSVNAGDGKILVNWAAMPTGDIAGYRLLCADENGDPLPNKGMDPPPLSEINVGKLFFTEANLCPDGPFGGDVPVDDTTGGSESGGSETGGSDSTGGGGSTGAGDETGGTTAGVFYEADDGIAGGGVTTGGLTTTEGLTTTDGLTTTAGDGTESGGETGIIGTDIPEDGILSMKWAYVCSEHIGGTSHEATVTGLENGKNYQFAIVAYDLAGNPIIASGAEPLTGSPRETTDFWEQCEIDGDVCGEGGFCNCSLDARPGSDALWLLAGFGALRLRRRRRGPVR